MKWFRVDKSATPRPVKGTYRDWKDVIRSEGKYQCAYCAIRESQFGGLRNFHIEHYRPRKHFGHLENDIANLFYSCAICNSFKGSTWMGDPLGDLSNAAFPCPSTVDFSGFLNVDWQLHTVASSVVAGSFLIERLHLNRPQLLLQRRYMALLQKIAALEGQVEQLLKDVEAAPKEMIVAVLRDNARVTRLLAEATAVAPYEEPDVR